MKSIYLIILALGALSLTSCKLLNNAATVDIDKYSATGQCILGCIESHGEVSPAPEEIHIVEP